MKETLEKDKPERIAKRIAAAGLCSRRDAERWIADGRVRVNGEILTTPARTVTRDDRIEVDGRPLPAAQTLRLFRYHKPPGLVTTARDEQGRPTVFDSLPKRLPRLISIGRLDLNTEGLLLLTTSGALARTLEHPKTGWKRTYSVRAYGTPDPKTIEKIRAGITLEGIRYAPADLVFETEGNRNNWLEITLTEGKNREVRKLLNAAGLQVNRLIRTSYGPYELDRLVRNEIQEIKGDELSYILPLME